MTATTPWRDAEEVEDVEVLAGLGHDGAVGRDDEEGEVDPVAPASMF